MSYGGGNSRARVDSRHPDAWGICDLCGQLRNLDDLHWQVEYRGNDLVRTGFRRCDACLDVPNQGLRPVILSPDPESVPDPRPPQWAAQAGPPPANIPVQQLIDGDDE